MPLLTVTRRLTFNAAHRILRELVG